MVDDAISGLDHDPVSHDRETWMTFTQCWCYYTMNAEASGASLADYNESMNFVVANCSEENL